MAVLATSLIRKRLRQRFGISAPKVAVRTHVSWYWRLLLVVAVLSLSLAAAAWVYDVGRRFAGFHSRESDREISSLRTRTEALETELAVLRQSSAAGESSVQIERSAKERLLRQVAQLEQENASLKEDLAFFESIVPGVGASEDGLKISRLRVEPEGEEGRYRYRLLIAMESGARSKEFRGLLQFHLKVQQAGKDVMMILPAEGDSAAGKFRLEIKRFLRTVGYFSIPKGTVLKGVEARLVQDGSVRAKQSLSL